MIPTWIARKATPEMVTEVIRHMKQNHTGQGKAAKKWILVFEMFGVAKSDAAAEDADRLMRRCFEIANQEQGGLIVSNTNLGYWWCASLSDGLEAAEANEARAMTILANARTVKDNIKRVYGGQLNF